MTIENELYKTSSLVKAILEESVEARNSDNTLYYMVLDVLGQKNGIEIDKMSMPHFLLHMKDYGFPGFETVKRTRQKIQHDHPELSGANEVEVQRTVNEEIFKEYAKGVNV